MLVLCHFWGSTQSSLSVFIKSQKPASSLQNPDSDTTETHKVLTPFAFLFEAFTSAFSSPIPLVRIPMAALVQGHMVLSVEPLMGLSSAPTKEKQG